MRAHSASTNCADKPSAFLEPIQADRIYLYRDAMRALRWSRRAWCQAVSKGLRVRKFAGKLYVSGADLLGERAAEPGGG